MNSYTAPLTQQQASALQTLLRELGFDFSPKPYTLFFAQKNKLSVAVYEKGPKVLLQGRGIEDFDAPAIRQIVREARAKDFRFSAMILGIATSTPFQMRRTKDVNS